MKYKLLIGIFLIEFALLANAQSPHFNANVQAIPKNIQQQMIGTTWKPNCPVPLNHLAYVTLSYWGYDEKPHHGVLIVNKNLAPQVVKIFKILYQHHFPIESMKPMYLYQGNDNRSMEANNTSAFNCRPNTTHPHQFSLHSYGRAIDINTRVNPYVKGSKTLPANGKIYADRRLSAKGMIKRDGVVYKTFHRFGWTWGGNWKYRKDYQHFQTLA